MSSSRSRIRRRLSDRWRLCGVVSPGATIFLAHGARSKWSCPSSAMSRSAPPSAQDRAAAALDAADVGDEDVEGGGPLLEPRGLGRRRREEQLVVVAAGEQELERVELLHAAERPQRRRDGQGSRSRTIRTPEARASRPASTPTPSETSIAALARRSRASAAPRATRGDGVPIGREQAPLGFCRDLGEARRGPRSLCRERRDPSCQAQPRRGLARMAGQEDEVARLRPRAGQRRPGRPSPESDREDRLGRVREVPSDQARAELAPPGDRSASDGERKILALAARRSRSRAGRTPARLPSRPGPRD